MFVSNDQKHHRCSRCGDLKPVSEFAWHREALEEVDTYCRPCRAAYKRAHYIANRQRYIAAIRRRDALVAQRTAFLVDYFRTHPCADCGETDPIILEFDHVGHPTMTVCANHITLRDLVEHCLPAAITKARGDIDVQRAGDGGHARH